MTAAGVASTRSETNRQASKRCIQPTPPRHLRLRVRAPQRVTGGDGRRGRAHVVSGRARSAIIVRPWGRPSPRGCEPRSTHRVASTLAVADEESKSSARTIVVGRVLIRHVADRPADLSPRGSRLRGILVHSLGIIGLGGVSSFFVDAIRDAPELLSPAFVTSTTVVSRRGATPPESRRMRIRPRSLPTPASTQSSCARLWPHTSSCASAHFVQASTSAARSPSHSHVRGPGMRSSSPNRSA